MRRPPTPSGKPTQAGPDGTEQPTSRNGAETMASGRSPTPPFASRRRHSARNERPQAPRTRDQPGRPITGSGEAREARQPPLVQAS
nr:MAG TPA: hypothetical protein [Caudoviricetes sp.]